MLLGNGDYRLLRNVVIHLLEWGKCPLLVKLIPRWHENKVIVVVHLSDQYIFLNYKRHYNTVFIGQDS